MTRMNRIGRTITSRLKELTYERKDFKRTQGWLAETVGVSNNAVSKWIKTGAISRENAQAVAEALELSVDELLSGQDVEAQAQPEQTSLDRLTADEKEILDLYRTRSPVGKEYMRKSARVAEAAPAKSVIRRMN